MFWNWFQPTEACYVAFLMTSEDKKMLEENPTKLVDSDTMIEEANAMHLSGLTPYFEVNKLKMN